MKVQVLGSCAVHLESSCKLLVTVKSALKACNSCRCFVDRNNHLSKFLGHRFAALISLQISGNFHADDGGVHNMGDCDPLSVVLGENVRHLRYLDIKSSSSRKGVYLKIATPLQLVSLQVLAEGSLDMNICDVGTLAAALQVFHLQGNKNLSQLEPLLTALRGVGKECHTYSTLSINRGANVHGVRWMHGCEQGHGQAIEGYFSACRCGACWNCLAKNGALDRLLHN